MNYQYYYRCYSSASAGGMRSGSYDYEPNHPDLSEEELLDQFDNHRNKNTKRHTALVSVTKRPLEALNRALNKYHADGEEPAGIWIICIRAPNSKGPNQKSPHHAQVLAQRLGLAPEESRKFRHEYLFEWEIPRGYHLRTVSLRTLLNRGIEELMPLNYTAQ
jgi:hypothetical protein